MKLIIIKFALRKNLLIDKKLNSNNKNILYLILSFSLFGLAMINTSCKSHKKVKEEPVYVGEQIETKKKKKKENKEISTGEKIAHECLTWIGTPYGYGHSEKGVSTDCSGMVIVVYNNIAGIKLPRNSAQQADFCDEIKEKDIKPGDLVFFATGSDRKKVSHVGVMIDGINFVHASGSKGVIRSEMTTPYYQRNFIKYGRVPGMK